MIRRDRMSRWSLLIYAIAISAAALVVSANGDDERVVDIPGQTSEEELKNTESADEIAIKRAVEANEERTAGRPYAERAEALQQRAGEQIGDVPQGRSLVLGMQVQEADNQQVKVIDVAAASPAFDAGIRKGDMLVSFDGFKAPTYRKWIDGMRKLAADAPDGDTIPIVLVRDGRQLNLRLRMPESNATPPLARTRTLNRQVIQPVQQQTVVPAGRQPYPFLGRGGGSDVLIANGLGDSFNNGVTTDRAVAEIFRLGAPMPQPPPQTPRTEIRGATPQRQNDTTNVNLASGPGQGARIGVAGFRDDSNGLFVMVDIGGLEPGNYIVSVEDPSLMTRGGNEIVTPQPRAPVSTPNGSGAVDPPQQQVTPGERPPVGLQNEGAAPTTPPPAGGTQPQGRLDSPAGERVLAQVSDEPAVEPAIVPTNQAETIGAPATDAEPVVPSAQGSVAPTGVPGTDQIRTANVAEVTDRQVQSDIADDAATTLVDPAPGAPLPVGQALNQIGVLTVDQSGTGRMQQVVEGLQVRAVVGMAIVISTQGAQTDSTLPPNLDATADPIAGRTGAAIPVQGESGEPGITPVPRTRTGQIGNSSTPVAAGLIRMLPDRPPADGTLTDGTSVPTNPRTPLTPQTTDSQGQTVPTIPTQPKQ